MVIYIASPYSGYTNKQAAVDAQIEAFAALLLAGHEPIAPLLSHYVDRRYPASYERWLRWGLAILARCDAVVRLPGESAGADREVALATALGKPVYLSVEEAITRQPAVPADWRYRFLTSAGSNAYNHHRGEPANLYRYDEEMDD